MKLKWLISTWFLILGVVLSASQAQGAPGQIEAALDDLSSRLGRAIALSQLANWRWEQKNFADASLGCESPISQSGYAAPGNTLGYTFLLTYNAVTYDYRVSHNYDRVILCAELSAEKAAAEQASESQYVNQLCPESAEPLPTMRSRINLGMEAEATAGPINLRARPSTDAEILLQIPAGQPFSVAAGPECVEGIVWWQAQAGDRTGYVAEGQDGVYLVQPKRPDTLPARETLTHSNISELAALSRISGNFLPQHDWNDDGSRLYLPGDVGSEGIWYLFFSYGRRDIAPVFVPVDESLTLLRARPNSDQVLFGTQDGSLHLWDVNAGARLDNRERLFLVSHDGPISALDFSPDGDRFVSAGHVAFTPSAVNRDFAAIVWDLEVVSQVATFDLHQGQIRDMAYSPDGSRIMSGADDGAMRLWNPNGGTRLAGIGLGAPVTDVEYSPDGRFNALVLGRQDSNLLLFSCGRFAPGRRNKLARRRYIFGVQPGQQAAGRRRTKSLCDMGC